MATDLFGKYYNNPTKSYIYTNLTCNTSSADEMSFDINGSAGQITTNSELLSSLDLSDIHVPMSQYTSDMRIIEPYQYLYVKGIVYGDTYCRKAFGLVFGEITELENWMYNAVLFFVIKYIDVNTGKRYIKSLKLSGNLEEEKTFIDVLNEYFEENEIPIVSSYEDGFIYFTSTKLGYEFWIDHVLLWSLADDVDIIGIINQWIVDNGYTYKYGWDDEYLELNQINTSNPYIAKSVYSSVIKRSDYERLYNLMKCLDTDFQTILEENDVKKAYLFEDITKYIAPKKYRNGAMLGCFLVVNYPEYKDDDILPFQRSLKLAHVVDRVQEFYAIPESLFEGTFTAVRKLIDVVDTYHSEYDSDAYHRWLGDYSHINGGDNWIDSDEVPQVVPEMFSKWYMSHASYIKQGLSIYKDIETRDAMGLDGYCAYLTKSNSWLNIGQMYAVSAAPDDENYPEYKNLIPSFIIYNPNPYPVSVKYLTFA